MPFAVCSAAGLIVEGAALQGEVHVAVLMVADDGCRSAVVILLFGGDVKLAVRKGQVGVVLGADGGGVGDGHAVKTKLLAVRHLEVSVLKGGVLALDGEVFVHGNGFTGEIHIAGQHDGIAVGGLVNLRRLQRDLVLQCQIAGVLDLERLQIIGAVRLPQDIALILGHPGKRLIFRKGLAVL